MFWGFLGATVYLFILIYHNFPVIIPDNSVIICSNYFIYYLGRVGLIEARALILSLTYYNLHFK